MLKDLHIAHITGTATVEENKFFSDRVRFDRPRRTVGEMFFKPYESSKEFKFCLRHTLYPLLILGLAVLDPIVIVATPAIFVAAATGCILLSAMNTGMDNKESASWWLNMANEIFSRLCQTIINLVVLPISAVALATRSISTVLQKTGVYDFDAPSAHTPDAPSAHMPVTALAYYPS
jgi:hypothetical protein